MRTYKEFIAESTRRKGERYDSSQGFDYHSDNPDVKITRRRDGMSTTIHHVPSGITYKIGHGDPKYSKYTDPDIKDTIHSHKPTHELFWHSNKNKKDMTPGERFRAGRNAGRVFTQHILPRIPSGHVLSNSPISSAHEKGYERFGFGRRGPKKSKQYATKIGNTLHPVHNDE